MKRLLILLMLVSQPAWAEWVEIGETGGGGLAVHYFDPATVRKTTHGRQALTLVNYVERSWYQTFQSVISLIEFDCTRKRSRFIRGTYYWGHFGRDGVLKADNTPTDWRDHPSTYETDWSMNLKAICGLPLK
jgi:hypothetical protein